MSLNVTKIWLIKISSKTNVPWERFGCWNFNFLSTTQILSGYILNNRYGNEIWFPETLGKYWNALQNWKSESPTHLINIFALCTFYIVIDPIYWLDTAYSFHLKIYRINENFTSTIFSNRCTWVYSSSKRSLIKLKNKGRWLTSADVIKS